MRLLLIGSILALGLLRSQGLSLRRESAEPTATSRAKLKCGYSSCPKSVGNKVNIHLVAHTHDDVGWLKTVDQYYYGARMNVQVAGVETIIDSVVDALQHDPRRKFIYVETAFLWKWWQSRDPERKRLLKQFVEQGQLEIIGGGWSMNDEATTHYHSLIDQFTWGFRRLKDELGECARPKVGWQIDPFGHSREQASIFAQMGFDGMFIGRLDYQDKDHRLLNKTGEFLWKASSYLHGSEAELFSAVLYNTYSPPPGFCFDILCQDAEPMIDDVNSPDYNIGKRVDEFLAYVNKQASYYRTNNVILTMGGDFTYQNAEMYFKNLDKVIRYVNERNGTRYNAFYSTPSCYLKALNEKNLAWPTKHDDFFPYASDPQTYWTGYYTSRPTLKYFERLGNNFLQVVKQLAVRTNLRDSHELQLFREAMGVMQHHDAVTGTEKQHVAEDYARLLNEGFAHGGKIAAKALNKLLAKAKDCKPLKFYSCLQSNVSSCDYTTEYKDFVVTLYNPTSEPLTSYVRLPVGCSSYSVRNHEGVELVTQLVPIPAQVVKIPGRNSEASHELVFQAADLPPLGFNSFYVSRRKNGPVNDELIDRVETSPVIGGKSLNVSVDRGTVKVSRAELSFNQTFHLYEAAAGNNMVFANRSSGAYIFRPRGNVSKSLHADGTTKVFRGALVEEIHQVVNEYVSQVVRVYKDKDYVEFEWLVGPIPAKDKVGREIIARYTSSQLRNDGRFYTDSNGREALERRVDHRPTWNLSLAEPISGNYYPVTSKITIQDEEKSIRLSALTDRAQGGSSLNNGQIELMLHRRLLHDDAFGVGEALNETAYGEGVVARGRHYLLASNFSGGGLPRVVESERALEFELALRPWSFLTPTVDSFDEWRASYRMKGEGVKGLPGNLRILTLEPWTANRVLLRLENVDETHSKCVKIADLIEGVKWYDEMTLGANQLKSDMNRLRWNAEATKPIDEIAAPPLRPQPQCLKPMQIKTYLLHLH